jgi:AraC-like DNA-binding protein
MPPSTQNIYVELTDREKTIDTKPSKDFLVFSKLGEAGSDLEKPPLSPAVIVSKMPKALVIVFGKGEHDFFNDLVGFLNQQQWAETEQGQAFAGIPSIGEKLRWDAQLHPNCPPSSATSILQPIDEFLKHVNQSIEKHLDDEDFRPCQLAKLCYLCEMQLHRRLKKLSNLSPANYIRKYRLWRGSTFLKNPALSVSEVCCKTGFRSLEYFSRSFKEEFGACPTVFRDIQH